MAADDAAVVVTLRANLKDYEAALKSAVRATERAASAAEKAISNVGKGGGASNVIQANFQKSAGAIANDARQLQFQLNDIFSGIASGQGVRAVQQQLGQIAQQLSGGGLVQGARTMASALVGMVNPINLAVVAFGFAASAAAAYFFETEEGGKDAEKTLQKQRDLIADAAKKWGDVLPALKAFNDELQRTEDIQKAIAAGQAVQAQVTEEIRSALEGAGMDRIQDAISAFGNFKKYRDDVAAWNTEWEALQKALDDGTLTLSQYKQFQEDTNHLMRELPMGELEQLHVIWQKAQELLQGYVGTLQQSVEETKKLTDATAQAINAINRLPLGQPGGIGPPVTSGAGVFNPSQTQLEQAEEAKREAKRAAEEAKRAATQASKEAAREAERTAKEAADKLTKAIANQSAAAVDAAATMLDMSETANRGEINAFLQSAGINLDAASTAWCAAFVNASLARVGIKGSGSNIATDFLNFGKGVDLAQIQKGDILVQARGHAAGEAGGHVGFATGQIRATAEGIQQVEMLSGNASDKVQKDWVDASGVVARRASDAFELPAGALDHLTAASDTAKTKLSEVEQAALDMQKAMQGAVSGLIKDLIDGKDASEALSNALGKVADAALQIGLNSLFSMGGPGAKGGILGGMLIPGVLHKGGIAGADGYGSGRVVPASTFRNARRYHSGGLVGGEVPAILQRGEIVIPRGSKVRPAGSHDTVSVNLRDDTGRMADIADQRIATASGTIVAVSVQKSSQQVVPTVGRYQAQQANSDYRTRR